MPTNIHFQDSEYVSQEASLSEDLVIEAIQIHGVDTFYIPRDTATGRTDLLFGEDVLSKFDEAYPIEMYIDRVEGFDGQGVLLAKFGLQLNNQADFIVSIRRFAEATNQQFLRPREGDLIYLKYKPNLFEVKYVEDRTEFFPLGKIYVYKIQVEAFRYGQEAIETGIPAIDAVETEMAYKLTLTLGSGSGDYMPGEQVYQGASYGAATAVAEVASWDNPSKALSIVNIVGEFEGADPIIGVLSSANYILDSYDILTDQNSPMNTNRTIQDEANTTLNFTESNPFSESQP